MSALPKDTLVAHAATRFEYCTERRTLRAIAVVDDTGRAPGAGEFLAGLVDRLNAATATDARQLRGGGRFEADLHRRELLLIREFDLAALEFDDLLGSLARLSRVARMWSRMQPGRAVATVMDRLDLLRDGGLS